ncbi:MAG: class I SAM-dependent methyltransferase, partial [Microcoleus sp. SIO2G3]|nr:class I SAM-dependent methyltransferase [Microcoleus sp. SIO2G3]
MKNYLKKILNRFGIDVVRLSTSTKKKKGAYIGCEETVKAAELKGLSLCDYVESIWNQQGSFQTVIHEMKNAGCLKDLDIICEIGPGTGCYLEKIQKIYCDEQKSQKYIIYETAEDWADWLEHNYAVIRRDADGKSLKYEPDNSCKLVHAHGVFVYLPFLHAFEYFTEMIRICAPGGYIVFDFYTDEHFNIEIINRWLASVDRYPVILPRNTVHQYFKDSNFNLIHEFETKCGHSYSH